MDDIKPVWTYSGCIDKIRRERPYVVRRALAERDDKIRALECSLADLETKSNQAVVAAQKAVASAEHARFNAEDAAASAAADAAATYMRLESSLSHAEQELRYIESSMDTELKNAASSPPAPSLPPPARNPFAAGSKYTGRDPTAASYYPTPPAPAPAPQGGEGERFGSAMRNLNEAEQKMAELELLGKQLLEVLGKAGGDVHSPHEC